MNTLQLVVGIFHTDEQSDQARARLQTLAHEQHGLIHNNIATIHRDDHGNVTFWETAEQREFEGLSIIGRLAGWLIGGVAMFLGAPLGPAYGNLTGALTAGDAAVNLDVGFANDRLIELGGYLHNGSVALVLLLDAAHTEPFVAAITASGGELMQDILPDTFLQALMK